VRLRRAPTAQSLTRCRTFPFGGASTSATPSDTGNRCAPLAIRDAPDDCCIVAAMSSRQGMKYVFKDFAHSSHRVLLQWAGQGPGKVLDTGAATGYLGARLAGLGWTVVGVDVDRAAAESAPPQYAAFHTLDVGCLPVLPEAPFDVVIAGDVLEHVGDPSAALACMQAQLGPAGRLLISVPNIAFVLVRLELLCGRFEYRQRGIVDATHMRFFTRRSLLRLLARAGLKVVRVAAVPPPLPLVSRVFARRPGWWVYEAAAVAARVRPTLFAYQLVIEARP
jgi:SAM-dependent methyltransferase